MSVPFQILYWMILLAARQDSSLAFAAAIALAVQKALYWPGFHSLMARYADQRQMGREFGVVNSLANVMQILGPFLGGWMSQHFGLAATFITAAIISCCSVLPLFRAKEIFVPKVYRYKDTWALYKTYPKKFFGYTGFGEELLFLTIWPVFIYIVVNNYQNTGLIVTVASLFAAILALIIGKITDQYTKRVLIKMGAFFSSLIWLARTIIPSTLWTVFAVDTLSRTSKEMDFIPISTVTYLRAEETHVVPYAVFFEQSLSVGKLIACLLGMLLFYLTGSFMVLFILGALFSLLYMYI
jgi:MFS family permease